MKRHKQGFIRGCRKEEVVIGTEGKPSGEISRREFLGISALATAGVLAGFPAVHASAPAADMVLLHGKIITVDRRDAIVEGVAIRGGEIIDAGTDKKAPPTSGTG